MESVLLQGSSPIVTFRILFRAGSALDPGGQEGVASLAAAMLSGGGSASLSYEEIVKEMYPMATSFRSQVDKEVTVFMGETHIDNLDHYYRIIRDMVLNPGWRADDFKRLKEDAINYLKVSLRGNNDEELAKEQLYNFIYDGTPYGHENAGTVESLERITLDDVKRFYDACYGTSIMMLGLAGGYPEGFPSQVAAAFGGGLAAGNESALVLPQPKEITGLQMQIVEKETRGTAISLGFPISVTRSHPDWPALLVAQSYLGQHRSSNSFLYKQMRQIRGLNYGDYAYIEYFPRGMFQFHPDPNLARQKQIFQIWVRPVEPQNGLFALRMALYELRKLVESGMKVEDFESTRRFLSKFVNVLVGTQDARLGYALDSRIYKIPEFSVFVKEQLAGLTLEGLNRCIRQYLQPDNVKIVAVTQDAEAFCQAVLNGAPSPMTYASPMPQQILDEDKHIENYRLGFTPDRISILSVDDVFQKSRAS
jgi:zinc protease